MEIELSKILDNPYQPRTTDNTEHIKNLALSIAADGLLQVPTARLQADGSVELAFGHSRRKAFEWLNKNWQSEGLPDRYDGYWRMPINVEEISDEQMYRYAVSENVQRKDLDAIELAKSMVVYRDQFGKNSDEIGALFGMSGATVRGKLRLLDLPAPIAAKLSSGDISEGTARTLLSMQKIASAQDLLDAVEKAKENSEEENPAYVINRFARNMDHVVEMWSNDGRVGKPLSKSWGNNRWQLDMKKFPNHLLPLLTGHVAVQTLNCFDDKPAQKIVLEIANYLSADAGADSGDKEIDRDYHNANKNQIQKRLDELAIIKPEYSEKLKHLINPSACNVCPFYTVMDGDHLCGMKVCHERKSAAWAMQRFEKMVKDVGIAVYSPDDGKFRLVVKG